MKIVGKEEVKICGETVEVELRQYDRDWAKNKLYFAVYARFKRKFDNPQDRLRNKFAKGKLNAKEEKE